MVGVLQRSNAFIMALCIIDRVPKCVDQDCSDRCQEHRLIAEQYHFSLSTRGADFWAETYSDVFFSVYPKGLALSKRDPFMPDTIRKKGIRFFRSA